MMEGGGEGVVAVVRWLSDKGLAVGVLTQPLRPVERATRDPGRGIVSAPPRRTLREPRHSQTFPERSLKHRPIGVGTDPYASTYQVTHCGVDACSPACWHKEFPPQRLKPSPALGNFEVCSRNHSPARSDVYSSRVEKDSGCQLFRSQCDRDVDAFVSSLRKYPSHTERTPSAELLEKLIKNSQTHSLKESPPPSKKRRHHWDKPQALGPLSRDRKGNRKPGPSLSDPKPSGPDKYPLPGPVSITAFDYLNSRPSSPKTPEKKADNKQHKNAFREARWEKRPVTAFPLCPMLRSRFEKHLKQYHPTTSKTPHVDFENLDTCSKCLKRRPCACETGRNMRRVVDKVEQERRQLEDAIFSWLKDIPVYPNENPHDKYIRDVIVKKLAESLCGMSEKQFDKEGKEEIERALQKLPMWYPSNEREREHFKNMITENLVENIKSIKELQSFDQTIEDFFDGITFTREINRPQVLNNVIAELNKIAASRPEDDNTYRDLLKMKAFELLDQLPIKTSGNKYEYLNQLSDELAEHLLNPHLDHDAKQTIKEEIERILDNYRVHVKNRAVIEEGLRKFVADIAIKDMDESKAESLIKCLLEGSVPADKIEAITTRVLALANQVKPIDAKLNQQAKQIVRDILDSSGVDIKNRVKIEEGIQKIARDVASENIDEDTAIDQVKFLLQGNVTEDQLSHITDQVLDMANQLKPTKLDQETKEMIKDDVGDVLDFSGVKIKDREKIENTLNKIVHDLATAGMDEEKAEAMIKSLLKGKVSEDKQDDIIDQVLKLANQVKPSQAPALNKETKQIIKDDIHDALDISGVRIKDREKIENTLNKIVHDVATTGMDEKKAEAMIESLLKGKVSQDKHDDIIDQVLKLANQVKPSQAPPLDKETKQIIKDDIHDALDLSGVTIKDRENIENTLNKIVHDIATTGMDVEKAEAMIKSLLKGKVPQNEQNDIIDQVLKLADQVKPIQTPPLDKETKQMIRGDIRDTLDLSGVKIKDRENIENTLNKIVHDIATTGMDAEKAEAMIKSLLKGKVPQNEQNDIIDQVLKLADQVKPIQTPLLDKETKQMIRGDIRDTLDLSGVKIKDRENIENPLNKIVHDIATTGMDAEKAEAMIKSLLKGKVPQDEQNNIIDQVLKLADQVKPIQTPPLDKETKQMIRGDIRDTLDLSGVKIKDRENVENTLNKIVHDIATTGIDEDKAEAMIKSLLKGKVPQDEQNNITYQVLKLADQVKPIQTPPLDKETKQMIRGDIRDTLDLSGVKIKDRENVENTLNKIVHDIATTGMDEKKAEAMIESLLKGKVPQDKHDDIIDQVLKLANQVKPSQAPPLDKETKQIIKDDIHDALDLSGVRIKDREKIENFLNKIVNDIATGMDEEKAEAMIKSLLKGKVPQDKQDDIIDQVLKLANQVKPIQAKPLDKETKQIIKDDIHDVLDLSGVKMKDREKIESNLNKIVQDIATTGMNEDKAGAMIKSLLKGKVSEDKQRDITNQILKLANKMKQTHSTPFDQDTKQTIKKNVSGIRDMSKSHLKFDPKFQESLKHDISDILTDTDIPMKNRSKVEESLRDIVSDIVMRVMDKNEAQDYINSTLKGKVSDSQAKEISKKVLALAEQKSLSLSRESSGPLASSTQYEDKIYHDEIYGKTRDWLKNIDIGLKDEQIDEVAKAIANETLDRQKYLQLNPGIKFSEKKESEILKEQIYKAANKFMDKKSVQSIMKNADDLMHSLKEIPPLQISSGGHVQDSVEFVQENLEGALLDWLRDSPIYQSRSSNNKQIQEKTMSNLAKNLASVLSSQTMIKSGAKSDEALIREIIKHLEGLPLEPQFKSKDYIRRLATHMLDYLKSLQLFQDISARGSLKTSQRTNSSLMPSTNHLNDIVNEWCEEIPLPSTDESFRIQQDLANKIVLKIGEMNMNQDILNDDSLYEEILQDFIDQQANALEIGQYITEDYKRVLIDQIKLVKQKVQDDLVGKAYKQQLRDTISNTIPSMACPTVDDLASFESMKENLADAFINLNYSGEDEAVKTKYKRRIIDEVNKYVNEYLNRCPAPPVNARKLNEDLYKALINVTVPGDESMRCEVETVRMKDLINDWLKTIPMHKQSQAELLRTNKIITLMAQKLQELENDFNLDFEDIAVEEIVTYLKKLPLKNKNNLNGMARRLVEKLKSTTDSRSFIDGTRSKLDDCLCPDIPVPPVCTPARPYVSVPPVYIPARPCNVPVPPPTPCIPVRASNQSCASFIPPCGLSKEDQELLRRIRERSQLCESGTQLRKRRDAAINPPPLDKGSQTEMPCQSKKIQYSDKSENVCSLNQRTKRTPMSSRPCMSTGSQADVSPYVLIKEYYWDSPSGNRTEFATQTHAQEPGRICIPSTPVSPKGICQSRECIRGTTSRPPRPRGLGSSSCRRTPKKQFTSACPNEYFSRSKPHNCMRHRPCQELRGQCKRGEPSCLKKKSSCLSCQHGPELCPNCVPLNVCPYPTCLYFK